MFRKIIFILLNVELICAASVADSWILFAKALKDSWTHCPVDRGLFKCFKQSSLEVFDKMVTADVIPLGENVRLERYHKKISFDSDANMHNNIWDRSSSLSTIPWSLHILTKLVDLFKTHTLSIGRISSEGRRRHNNNMLPMAVLGVTAFGVFAVPMGFQFLLILCGKAVLLSKMALLLSSINGSSRVEHAGAAPNGLYRPDIHNHGHGYHNYWNREDMTQPRSRGV